MIYSKLLALAVCCGAAYSQSEEVTVYSDVGCKGESLVIKTDNQCTSLSEAWVNKISGAKIPDDAVCNFFSDNECINAVFYGMEGPGSCDFADPLFNFDKETRSVQCYLSDPEDDE